MTKRKFAVFDIDGTIFRSSLLIELVEELISEKLFPQSARQIYTAPQKAWLDRKGSYDKYIGAVVKAFDSHLKGVPEKDFRRAVRNMVRKNQDRVYRFTRDLAADLKRRGYFLLAISHSPKYVVDAFAKRMGFTKVYGRLFELDSRRRFTGQAFYLELIDDKSRILKRAVTKEKLTLKDSVGVGDTDSDIAFLKMVERPICFNPNRRLYNHARRQGWEVVVERKDVVYHLRTGK